MGNASAGQDSVFTYGFDNAGGSKGDGIVIGDIDTGYNHLSPSFASTDDHGYSIQNPLGAGHYLGYCAGSSGGSPCNPKVIGVFDKIGGIVSGGTANPTAEDTQGHGSHTASTSGGDSRSASYYNFTPYLSGVAPHANLIIYYACSTSGCSGASTAASVDQSIADGTVDVLTYSISGGNSPWHDNTSLAFLSAVDAGIFVAAAAGNTQTSAPPLAGSTNHQEPWVLTVGASTHTGGPASYQLIYGSGIVNTLKPAASGTGLSASVSGRPILNSPTYGSASDGCTAYSAGAFTGSVALLKYGGGAAMGGCPTATMAQNAHTAGASYIIIVANTDGSFTSGAHETIPVFTISQTQGDALRTYVAGHSGTTVAVNLPSGRSSHAADVLADFSLLGPAKIDVIKPDVEAPGVSILAAVANSGGAAGANKVDFLDGTSMATPHAAGAGAVVMAAHRDWTPMEIKSALMMTAKNTGLTAVNGVTPANFFERGAGRIQVDAAIKAGLVMNELGANLSRANPDNPTTSSTIDGNPMLLNLPSMQNSTCVTLGTGPFGEPTSQATCSFTRSFRSTQDHTVSWTATVGAGPTAGVTGAAIPSSFSIAAGARQTIRVSMNATSHSGAPGFFSNELVLTPSDPNLQPLHLPIAVQVPPPSIATTPTQLVIDIPSGMTTSSSPLNVFNVGGPTLTVNLPNYVGGFFEAHELVVANQPSAGDDGSVSTLENPVGALVPYNVYTATAFRVFGNSNPLYGGHSYLSRIVAPGFTTSNPLADLPCTAPHDIHFEIYADAGGMPAGNPEAPGSALWSAVTTIDMPGSDTCLPVAGTPGLDVTDDTITLDFLPAGGGGVTDPNLPEGIYWLVIYPELDPTVHPTSSTRDNLWVWYGSKHYDIYPSMAIVPSHAGAPEGQWSQANTYPPGQAVKITQLAFCTTMPAWLSITDHSNDVGGNVSLTGLLNGFIQIQADSTQYPGGTTSKEDFLCFQTTDPVNPYYVVPILSRQH